MPRRDGTGPYGEGSMTGWGMGPCASAGSARGGGGMRMGMMRRMRGGRGWFSKTSKEDEKKMLLEEKKYLEEELELVKKELSSVKK